MRGRSFLLLASLGLWGCPAENPTGAASKPSSSGAISSRPPTHSQPLRLRTQAAELQQLAISSGGDTIARWSSDGALLQPIETRTLQPLVSIRRPKSARVQDIRKVVVSPDGKRVLVLSASRLDWWQSDGQGHKRLKIPPRCLDKSLSFSPDGRLFALVGCGDVPWVWRTSDAAAKVHPAAETATQKAVAEGTGKERAVHRTLLWSSDGKHALLSGRRASLWNLATPKKLRDLPVAQAGLRWANLGWHPDGRRFVFAPGDGSASLYTTDSSPPRPLLKTLTARGIQNGDPRIALSFRPDGNELSLVDAVGGLHRFSLPESKKQRYDALPPRLFGQTSYDSSGQFVAYPTATGGVALFDFSAGGRAHKLCDKIIAYDSDYGDMRWAKNAPHFLCYSESKAQLVSATTRKNIGTGLDLGQGRALPEVHTLAESARFLIAGRALVSVDTQSGQSQAIDQPKKEASKRGNNPAPHQLVVHPSGRWALYMGEHLRLLDIQNGKRFFLRFGKKARLVLSEDGRFYGALALAKQELRQGTKPPSLSALRRLQLKSDPLKELLQAASSR